MNELRVVSIGGFGHAGQVFGAMQAVPEAAMVGMARGYEGESIENFRRHAVCASAAVYESYTQMLSELKPDLAVISTRLDRIAPIALDALEAGCHVMCEKPLALERGALRRIYETSQAKGLKVAAMLSMHDVPAFRAARQVYQSGAIGEVVMANGRKSYKWGERPEWFGDKTKYGGTIGWVGIHALDFIHYITGVGYSQVAAMGGNRAHPERPGCEDHCGLVLELSNGGHATVSVDILRPEASVTHGDDWVRIVGTKGVLEAGCAEPYCRVIQEAKGSLEAILPEAGHSFQDFLESLLDKGRCEIAGYVPFMLTEVCLLAQESLETGCVKKIDSSLYR